MGVDDRVAYRPAEAAALLGVSESYFYKHVRPKLKVARVGGSTLIPRKSLERWLDAWVQ
jgi:excisionase family DNA binding protein